MTKGSDGARLPDGAPGADVRASGEGSALAAERQAKPFPKSAQLARGERRRPRKVATAQEWGRIIRAKRGPCRVCGFGGFMEWHHLVPRARGGDDVADNIVPLGHGCHWRVTENDPVALAALAASLTDAERDYIARKLGPGGMERLFAAHSK